jgi:hypothetical protein
MADPSWQLALARYRIPRRLATRARQSSFQVASTASILIVTLASGHSRKITEREWARSLPLLDRAGRAQLIQATLNSSYIGAVGDDLRRA